MKKIILLIICLAAFSNASEFSNQTMKSAYAQIVAGNYDSAVVEITKNSPLLKEKLNTRNDISQLGMQIKMLFDVGGKISRYELLKTDKVGPVEKSQYLIYCDNAPIKFELIEYTNDAGKKSLLVFTYDMDSRNLF